MLVPRRLSCQYSALSLARVRGPHSLSAWMPTWVDHRLTHYQGLFSASPFTQQNPLASCGRPVLPLGGFALSFFFFFPFLPFLLDSVESVRSLQLTLQLRIHGFGLQPVSAHYFPSTCNRFSPTPRNPLNLLRQSSRSTSTSANTQQS